MYDDDDDGYSAFLQEVIDMGFLSGAALGITKQVIGKGESSLTEKQKYVFKNEVLDHYTIPHCKRCQGEIPWPEMYNAATEHGMCGYCESVSMKDD